MSGFVPKMKRFPSLSAALVSLLSIVLIGCEKPIPTGTVKGKVLLDEAPYTDGSVCFLDLQTGQAGSANIQSDGTFQLEAPLRVGTYKVYLAPKAAQATDEPQPVTMDESVPDKYWNEASTDISIDVAEGENDVTVQVKK